MQYDYKENTELYEAYKIIGKLLSLWDSHLIIYNHNLKLMSMGTYPGEFLLPFLRH